MSVCKVVTKSFSVLHENVTFGFQVFPGNLITSSLLLDDSAVVKMISKKITYRLEGTIGLLRWLPGKESACPCRRLRFDSWVGKILLRRKWQPIPVCLPGEFHAQRSLLATVHGFENGQT